MLNIGKTLNSNNRQIFAQTIIISKDYYVPIKRFTHNVKQYIKKVFAKPKKQNIKLYINTITNCIYIYIYNLRL